MESTGIWLMAKTFSRFRIPNKVSFCEPDSCSLSGKRVSRTINNKISSKILLEIKPIDYHDRRNFQFLYANTTTKTLPFPGKKIRWWSKSSPHLPIKVSTDTPLPSQKIFNPSNHMTRRAIKNILQSETTVKSWWHESEIPSLTVSTRGFLFAALSAYRRQKKIKEAVRVAKFANKE